MLEGDENTLNAIHNEQMEIRKHRLGVDEGDLEDLEVEDEIMDDAEIEVASDDIEDEDFLEDVIGRRALRGKRVLEDEDADEAESNSDEGEEPEENEDNESASVPAKKRSRKE